MSAVTRSGRLPAAALTVAATHLALEFFHNFLPVVYPLLIESMDLTYARVGTLALMGSLFGSLMQPAFGLWSDRWSARSLAVLGIVWSSFFMGLVGLVGAYVGHYWLLLPVVALAALGSAAYHPAGASLATSGINQRRGTAISIFSVGGNIGTAVSPIIISALLVWLGLPGIALLIPLGLLTGLLLWRQMKRYPQFDRQPAPVKPASASPVTGAASETGSRLAIALIIVIVAARSWFQGSLMTYLPQWLRTEGVTPELAGTLFSMLLVGVTLGSLTGGTISDRVGRVPVVVSTLGLMGPAHWLFMHSSGIGQFVLVVFIGFLIGATFPAAIVLAQEAWPKKVGLASALVMGLGFVPSGIGSWAIGKLADQSTLTGALSTLAFAPAVGVAAALLLAWRRPSLR